MSVTDPDYSLNSVVLYADRTGAESFDDLKNTIDATGAVVEISIYENIERNYLTGTLLLLDTVSFRKIYKIQGTEHLRIDIDIKSNRNLVKEFIITGIEKSKHVEAGEVLLLSFIEPHGYYGAVTQVSRSFEGTPQAILKNINKVYFGKETKEFYSYSENTQRPLRYISPNISTHTLVDNIRDRMFSRVGGSYFSYSKLNDDSLILGSLDYLLKQEPFSNKPFFYTQAKGSLNEVDEHYSIDEFSVVDQMSTLEMAAQGVIKSLYNVYDLTSGNQYETRHELETTLNEIAELDEIDVDPELLFVLNGGIEKGLYDISTRTVSNVVASRAHATQIENLNNDYRGFHENNPNESNNVLRSALLRTILINSMYSITTSGLHHTLIDTSGIGSIMNINFVSPTVYYNGISSDPLDPNRSGRYMVYRIVHKFFNSNYKAVTDVVRLGAKK